MNEETKPAVHAPTPWRWQQEIEGAILEGKRRFPIYTATGKFGHPAEAKTEADAEFICRAVNNHEALIQACQEALEFVEGFVDGAPDASQSSKSANWLDHLLRTAITKAEGGAA